MSPELERARAILREQADRRTNDLADRLVADGVAEWVLDPYVRGTVGLIRPGTNRAWIVVYVDDEDWEVSDEFDLLPNPKPDPKPVRDALRSTWT